MKSKRQITFSKSRLFWSMLVLVVAGGLGYWMWQVRQPATTIATQPEVQTVMVQRGDLANTITGTGSLVAGSTLELGFTTTGTLGELGVAVGDHVTAGQTLAVMAEITQLKIDLSNKKIALQTAQKDLEDLLSNGDQKVAQALADQAAAESAYAEAKKNYHQKGDGRCAVSKTQSYYFQYLDAQQRVDEWEGYLASGTTGYGKDYILSRLAPMRQERDLAYANLKYCESYSELEILQSDANLKVAKANLDQAQKAYQDALVHSGIAPEDVALAQAAVNNAELQVTQAKKALNDATLVAPMDGTITAINASVGQEVGEKALLTLADLDHPVVKVSIDEADLAYFKVGCPAEVIFTSVFPDRTFEGVVTQVDPLMVTFREVGAAQGLVNLKDASLSNGKTLMVGLRGTVDITCTQATQVLLLPITALHQDAENASFVYILNNQGQAEKRAVETGLKSSTYAEVINGLNEGDLVITSAVKTK